MSLPREFTKQGRLRQPERHLKVHKASIVSIRYLLTYHPKGQTRPPRTTRCLKTIFSLCGQTFKTTEFYFAGLDLQYRTPEIGFPSFEIGKDNFRVSQGKEIRTKNKESLESKILKQKQHCRCRRRFVNWLIA